MTKHDTPYKGAKPEDGQLHHIVTEQNNFSAIKAGWTIRNASYDRDTKEYHVLLEQ